MYATVRRYEGIDKVRSEEIASQAHESTRIAARWVRAQKLESVLQNTPKNTAGPMVAHESGGAAVTNGVPASPRAPRNSSDETRTDRDRYGRTVQGGLFMNLQPLGDRLIVEVLEEEESTVSGIVLPDTAKEKPQRGRVLAVGPGARDEDGKRIEMDVAEGDEVIFAKYGGTEIKLGTDEVLILRESDVLAKVTPRTNKSKRKREPAGATA
jgi:chaperonin GroES